MPSLLRIGRRVLTLAVEKSLAVLDHLPEFVGHDPKFGHLGHNLSVSCGRPSDAAPGRGILQPRLSAPDLAPDVKLVVEDAGTFGAVAVDRRRRPRCAARGRDTLRVQGQRNPLGREAVGEVPKNPSYDCGLRLVDDAVTALGGVCAPPRSIR